MSLDAVRAFAARDLAALAASGGLDPDTSLDVVAAEWGADPQRCGRHFLGHPPAEAFWCPASLAGFDGTVRIWFRGDRVVKIEGQFPDLAPDDLHVLGPPEAELDYRRDVSVVAGGERLWASRGIAAKLNRSARQVVALSIFSATTVDGFTAGVRGTDDYREAAGP